MSKSKKMFKDKVGSVNLSLLPVKLHYFVFYGAMGGVQKFLPLLAKGHGINATAVGLVYTVLPFCIFFSKPLFGYVTDYFKKIKLIVIILMSVTALAYFSVLFIPKSQNIAWTEVQVECETGNRWLSVKPRDYDKMCLLDALKQIANCELNYLLCASNSSATLLGETTIDDTKNGSTSLFLSQSVPDSSIVLKFVPDTNYTCDCVAENSSHFRCARHDVNSCFQMKNQSVYKSFRFWVFALLAVISGTGAAVIYTLSDTLCYEVLGDKPQHYGRQRMWASFGWGCFSLLAGLMNDMVTGSSDIKNYSPGFYLMLALVVINIILMTKIKLTKANISFSIMKDIGKVFSSCDIVVFAVSVYILGGLTGLVVSYQFWYLQDLGANQTLLGLTAALPCLVIEVPVFYFTGWLVKKLGYFNCVIGLFGAYGIRLGLYYILINPWLVLPIELINSLIFAVFLAAMTGYASNNAPPGTEATMLGILGGLFDGLGVATGSLLGGVGFDMLGGRRTFLVASAISGVCTLVLIIICTVMKKLSPKSEARDMSQEKTNCGVV